jgi:hypothetical protein
MLMAEKADDDDSLDGTIRDEGVGGEGEAEEDGEGGG